MKVLLCIPFATILFSMSRLFLNVLENRASQELKMWQQVAKVEKEVQKSAETLNQIILENKRSCDIGNRENLCTQDDPRLQVMLRMFLEAGFLPKDIEIRREKKCQGCILTVRPSVFRLWLKKISSTNKMTLRHIPRSFSRVQHLLHHPGMKEKIVSARAVWTEPQWKCMSLWNIDLDENPKHDVLE